VTYIHTIVNCYVEVSNQYRFFSISGAIRLLRCFPNIPSFVVVLSHFVVPRDASGNKLIIIIIMSVVYSRTVHRLAR